MPALSIYDIGKDFIEAIRTGDYFRERHTNVRYQVRGVVDERFVMRTWWKHKRRWHYETFAAGIILAGLLSPERKRIPRIRKP